MLLAIDTATKSSSVALYAADGVQAELAWRSQENQTVELLPQIIRLLELIHAKLSDVKAIAAASGPGSYTGLRVGMSLAKGFAYGAGIPIFGIPTLDIVAHSQSSLCIPVWAMLAAGRGRYSVAKYVPSEGKQKRVNEYALVDSDGLIVLAGQDKESSPVLFCGEFDEPTAQKLARKFGVNAVIASPAMNVRRAAFMAELAWSRFQRGETDEVASLAPTYAPFT